MTAWGPQGSGAGRSRWLQANRNTAIIVAVAVVLIVLIVRSHNVRSGQLIYFCVLVPSIILHEISHGAVALAFGDTTAKRAGRLNLNPIRHVDPVGTLLVPAVLSLSGFGAYGWAKPVPVNPGNLRSPRNHTVLVSLVGPLTNVLLAALMGVGFVAVGGRAEIQSLFQQVPGLDYLYLIGFINYFSFVQQVFIYAGLANIVLAIFNLIPCPPLDGAAVLERMLPSKYLPGYWNLQPFLMFLPFILILLFRNEWSWLINHVFAWWLSLLG